MTSSGVTLQVVVIPVAALVGLFVGSFLNVVVYRAPLGLSVSTPRSFCPTCDRQLTWWENIPLLSWLFLRGRCHTCHQRISVRYPLVEVTTALVFGLVAWAWHGTLPTIGYCVLAAAALSIALIEYGGQRAPLAVAAVGVSLGGSAFMVCSAGLGHWSAVFGSLVGLLLGVGMFGVLRALDPACRDPRAHGRTALPVAGVWLGGLGGLPTVAGLAAWILTSFACLVVVWSVNRSRRVVPDGDPPRSMPPGAAVPLVTGILVALAVSLGVAA